MTQSGQSRALVRPVQLSGELRNVGGHLEKYDRKAAAEREREIDEARRKSQRRANLIAAALVVPALAVWFIAFKGVEWIDELMRSRRKLGLDSGDPIQALAELDWVLLGFFAVILFVLIAARYFRDLRRSKHWHSVAEMFRMTEYPLARAEPEQEAFGILRDTNGNKVLKVWAIANADGVFVRDSWKRLRFTPFCIEWDQIHAMQILETHRIKNWGNDYIGVATLGLVTPSELEIAIPWRGIFSDAVPDSVGFKTSRAPWARDA